LAFSSSPMPVSRTAKCRRSRRLKQVLRQTTVSRYRPPPAFRPACSVANCSKKRSLLSLATHFAEDLPVPAALDCRGIGAFGSFLKRPFRCHPTENGLDISSFRELPMCNLLFPIVNTILNAIDKGLARAGSSSEPLLLECATVAAARGRVATRRTSPPPPK
jgi:hypothetical protein